MCYTAGFIHRQGDWTMLCVVLLGNFVGCNLYRWTLFFKPEDMPF